MLADLLEEKMHKQKNINNRKADKVSPNREADRHNRTERVQKLVEILDVHKHNTPSDKEH